MAKITLYGFYKWMKNAGDDLFSELNVPAGLDKNTLIDNIIIRGGEYEVLYADPYFMQDAIRVWSDKWQSTFTRWVDAMAKDYDPLYNYDRYEEWTDNNTGTIDNKLSGTNSGTVTDTGSIHDQGTVRDTGNIHDQGTVRDTGTIKDTGDIKNSGTQKFDITEQHSGGDDTTTTRTGSETAETDMDTTTTKAAYNSNTLLPDNKVEQDGTVTTTYNSVKDVVNHDDSLKIVTDNDRTDDLTTTNNLTRTNDLTTTNNLTRTNDLTQTNDLTRTNNLTRTDNLAHSESSTRTDNMTSTHDAHIYGNIGVTTSSAMLAEYMDTQAKYQLVDQITDIFLREFVIPIF